MQNRIQRSLWENTSQGITRRAQAVDKIICNHCRVFCQCKFKIINTFFRLGEFLVINSHGKPPAVLSTCCRCAASGWHGGRFSMRYGFNLLMGLFLMKDEHIVESYLILETTLAIFTLYYVATHSTRQDFFAFLLLITRKQ